MAVHSGDGIEVVSFCVSIMPPFGAAVNHLTIPFQGIEKAIGSVKTALGLKACKKSVSKGSGCFWCRNPKRNSR